MGSLRQKSGLAGASPFELEQTNKLEAEANAELAPQ